VKKQISRLLFLGLLTVGTAWAPAAVSAAGPACGACSYNDCGGAAQGSPCFGFSGKAGTCRGGGRYCGPNAPQCTCVVII
jgi:hypothetical protein